MLRSKALFFPKLAAFIAALVTSTAAGAEPAPAPRVTSEDSTVPLERPAPSATESDRGISEKPSSHSRRWYGWQTLAADSVGIGVFAASTLASYPEERALRPVGHVAFAVGAPIVHFAHGSVWKGIGSFGIHAGAPLAGGLIGHLLDPCLADASCGEGSRLGVLTGMAVASAADAAFLAWDAPATEPRRAASRGRRLALAPHLGLGGDGAVMLGVSGHVD